MAYKIRTYGDPVLKTKAAEVTDIDGKIARLVDDMFDTLYDSDSGIALAAPQIGVQKQIFVLGSRRRADGHHQPADRRDQRRVGLRRGLPVHPRPVRRDAAAEPGAGARLHLDGDEIEIEADELMGRLFQHEIDHLARRADVRPDDARAAQGGHDRVPPAAGDAADRGSEASPAIAVTPRRAAALAWCTSARRRWRCRRFERSWRPASTSRSSSPAPTSAAAAAAQLMPSPVKAAAVELGLPVSHTVDDALDAGADLGVVVAFGQLIKPHVLDALPMVNLHFSLLPRWRGAAPVERALLAGDTRPACA